MGHNKCIIYLFLHSFFYGAENMNIIQINVVVSLYCDLKVCAVLVLRLNRFRCANQINQLIITDIYNNYGTISTIRTMQQKQMYTIYKFVVKDQRLVLRIIISIN